MSQSETITDTTETPKRTKWRRAIPRWAQIVILLVVFAAGGVVGGMIAAKVIYLRMDYYRRHTNVLPNDIVPRLKLRLGLTDEQTKQVREIIERRHPRMIENRKHGAQVMLNEFDAMEQEIADVLDERQKRMWHAMADSVHHRFLPPAPGE
jgi:hypothetical protein